MTRHLVLTLPTLALLAACGGGEDGGAGGSTPFDGVTQFSGQSFGISTTSADSVRISIPTSASRTLSVGASTSASDDQQVFRAYRNAFSQYLIFDAVSDDGRVSVFANHNDTSPDSLPGARAQSFGGTLPASGSASYTGEYVGFLTRDATTSVPGLTESYIVGDVSLTADFARGSASGAITNRDRYLTSNGGFASDMGDVTLSNLSFDSTGAGTGGQTSGGRVDLSRYQPAGGGTLDGSWGIAFGGDDATSAGGTVEIIHDYDNTLVSDDYIETGGFVAAKN